MLTKNPSNYNSLKVNKFSGDSVKNKGARTKKTTGGGVCVPNAPPSLFRVEYFLLTSLQDERLQLTAEKVYIPLHLVFPGCIIVCYTYKINTLYIIYIYYIHINILCIISINYSNFTMNSDC